MKAVKLPQLGQNSAFFIFFHIKYFSYKIHLHRQFYTKLLVNFIFTMIWTILTAAFPQKSQKGKEMGEMFYKDEYSIWTYPRIVLEVIGLSMALYFIAVVSFLLSSLRFDHSLECRPPRINFGNLQSGSTPLLSPSLFHWLSLSISRSTSPSYRVFQIGPPFPGPIG